MPELRQLHGVQLVSREASYKVIGHQRKHPTGYERTVLGGEYARRHMRRHR